MWDVLGKIFGADKVIDKISGAIDDLHYSDSEREEDKREALKLRAEQKIKLLNAYSPFKLAQRYIAFGFTFIFLFIMLNGVLGAMYGIVDIENVKQAKEFANQMWLGEIMLGIVGFYFSGGLAESVKRKENG